MTGGQAEQYRRDLAARARLWDQGIRTDLPLPVDRTGIPEREGHGSVARYLQHQRAGEEPCPACQDAFHRYRFPQGRQTPDRWALLFAG